MNLLLEPVSGGLPLLLSVFCAEIVLALTLVHAGVGLFDLLLDFLLHLLGLGLGHSRPEPVLSAVAALSAAVAVIPFAVLAEPAAVLSAAVSALRLIVGSVYLGDVDLLALSRFDSFSLALLFRSLELAQIYLAHNLRPGKFLDLNHSLARFLPDRLFLNRFDRLGRRGFCDRFLCLRCFRLRRLFLNNRLLLSYAVKVNLVYNLRSEAFPLRLLRLFLSRLFRS